MKKLYVTDYVESNSNLIQYAIDEFKRIGWMDNDCKFPEPDEEEQEAFGMNMQEKICVHLLELLSVFSDEEHSGTSGSYTLHIFNRLVNFKPLSPIEDKPECWKQISKDLFQHKHYGSVFKDASGKAWDNERRIFYRIDENGEPDYYSSRHSTKEISFPYHVPYKKECWNEREYMEQHPDEYTDEEKQELRG